MNGTFVLPEHSPHRTTEYDFFVSYASADNRDGLVDAIVNAIIAEHAAFTGGRQLKPFIDRHNIANLSHWHDEIFNKGLVRARFFLAFLSPEYFASEVCRKEWKAWLDQEIALHIFTGGAAPIYFIEIPGFIGPRLSEREVASNVAELCKSALRERFANDLSDVVKEARRRQIINLVKPFQMAGVQALQEADLRQQLKRLGKDIEERAEECRRAEASENTVPQYNPKFTGRLTELIDLRKLLTDNHAGVIAGIHGLGGIGKTELAFTFAHAYAGVYPGGRFYVRCENQTELRQSLCTRLDKDPFHDEISDEERKNPEANFNAVYRCLQKRLQKKGGVLLVLDNVSDFALLAKNQTEHLTRLGPSLHILATTRLASIPNTKIITLGELSPTEGLALLDKFRTIITDADREAAEDIVQKLGGFALALELVAARLAVHPTATYSGVAKNIGLDKLDTYAEDQNVELRRHNHEKRLAAILLPVLAELAPVGRRMVEYAALLPPDHVAVMWLRELIATEFPHILEHNDDGEDLWYVELDGLLRLGLLSGDYGEKELPRMVRVHRLVQELVRTQLSNVGEQDQRQERLNELVERRTEELTQTSNWLIADWELETLDSLAWIWDTMEHSRREWLFRRIGQFWHRLAQWERAEVIYRRALTLDEETVARRKAMLEERRVSNPELAEAFEKLLSMVKPENAIATDLSNLALLLKDTDRLAEAEPLFRRAIALGDPAGGLSHPALPTFLGNLALLLSRTNRAAEAEALLRRALVIDETNSGLNDPSVASKLNNLSTLYSDTDRLSEAEATIRRAIKIFEASGATYAFELATSLHNLGAILMKMNRYAEAYPFIQQAEQTVVSSFGSDHPLMATVLTTQAKLFRNTNRQNESEALYTRALAINEASFGPDHTSVALVLNDYASLLHERKDVREAEKLYRRALAINEACYGPVHSEVATVLKNLATLLFETGRLSEAEPLEQRALAIRKMTDSKQSLPIKRSVIGKFTAWVKRITGIISCK